MNVGESRKSGKSGTSTAELFVVVRPLGVDMVEIPLDGSSGVGLPFECSLVLNRAQAKDAVKKLIVWLEANDRSQVPR